MTVTTDPAARTIAALNVALNRGAIPGEQEAAARSILERLDAPARITLAGLGGAGRSSALNVLAGARVLPLSSRVQPSGLPTIQVCGGADETATLTLAGGATLEVEGAEARPEAIAARGDVAFAVLRRDLPALAKISLLELPIRDEDALRRATDWAGARTDVAIWCTTSWSPAEQRLWAAAPARMRDNAILLRARNGAVGSRPEAAEGFAQTVAADLAEALAARRIDGTLDAERMRASGGADLVRAVRKLMQRVRQALLDGADLLLTRHAPDLLTGPLPGEGANPIVTSTIERPVKVTEAAAETPAVVEEGAPAEPKVETALAAVDEDLTVTALLEAVAKAVPSGAPAPAVEVEPASGPAQAPVPAATPKIPPHIEAEAEFVFAPAPEAAAPGFAEAPAAFDMGQAAEVIRLPAPVRPNAAGQAALVEASKRLGRLAEEATPGDLVERTVHETGALAEAMDEVDDPALASLQEALWMAADTAQLLKVEGGEDAAGDAVCLLLQIRDLLPFEAAA